MIDEEALSGLADNPRPVVRRAESDVRARTGQLRRQRRRTIVAGTTGAVVAAILAVAAPILLTGPQPTGTIPADGSSPSPRADHTPPAAVSPEPTAAGAEPVACPATGSENPGDGGTNLDPARSAVNYLPPESLTGPASGRPMLTLWFLRGCNVMPAYPAGWYAVDGGSVARTLTVTGPGALSDMPNWEGSRSTFDLHGRTADLGFDPSARFGHAEWLIDGQQWSADAHGLSKAQFAAALRTVVITNGKVDMARIPAGLSTAFPDLEGPTLTTSWHELSVSYGQGNAGSDFASGLPKLQLTVAYGRSPTLDPDISARHVTIDGRPGWLYPPGGHQVLVWQVADGAAATLIDYTGELGSDRLLEIARQTVPVPPTDPRWTTSP